MKNHSNVQKKSGENHKSICEQLPFTKTRSAARKVVLELVISNYLAATRLIVRAYKQIKHNTFVQNGALNL